MRESKPVEDKILATPLDLAELVDYQDGSVVSRAIVDKEVGTVTIFAFDKGQKLSTHSAPFDALVQILDGRGLIIIEDKEFPLAAPAAIIMPAGKPHAVNAPEKFKMLLTMIREK
ncbi:MAG: cupin domain-containing protein [Acidobacteriota bacterium]|nr:cupin domain-containing protein [Acidobacteriota bacterium]